MCIVYAFARDNGTRKWYTLTYQYPSFLIWIFEQCTTNTLQRTQISLGVFEIVFETLIPLLERVRVTYMGNGSAITYIKSNLRAESKTNQNTLWFIYDINNGYGKI